METLSQTPESEIIRLKGGGFLRLIASANALPWIGVAVVLLLLTATMAIFLDLRWLVVCLMILFLLIPMATAFFYFNHGLREVTVLNTLPHKLRFIPRGIVLTQYEGEEEIKSWLLPYSDLDRFFTAKDCVMVPMKDRKRGFIWIPEEGFAERTVFIGAIEMLGRGLRDNNQQSI